jgi:replicative DNA helicase
VTAEIAKPLPANLDAERALLGAALLNPASALELLSLTCESDFFLPENRRIFLHIQSLLARGIAVDLLTLTDDLQKCGVLERAG